MGTQNGLSGWISVVADDTHGWVAQMFGESGGDFFDGGEEATSWLQIRSLQVQSSSFQMC